MFRGDDDPTTIVVVTCRLPRGVTAEAAALAAEAGVWRVAYDARAYNAPHPDREEGEEP